MTDTTPIQLRARSAERMRISRQRRRNGLRCVPFEVRDTEVEALVAYGLIDPTQRQDRKAIARGLGKLLDYLPVSWWQAATDLRRK